jgi:hypothetical protein
MSLVVRCCLMIFCSNALCQTKRLTMNNLICWHVLISTQKKLEDDDELACCCLLQA